MVGGTKPHGRARGRLPCKQSWIQLLSPDSSKLPGPRAVAVPCRTSLPPRPVFIHALPFCCSKHGQKAPRRLGQCPCPSGDSLQDHATRDHSPGTAPAAQCTAACAGPEGSGSMQQCRNLSSSSRYMPSCPKTSNQPAAGLKGRSVVGDQGHPPTVSTGPFSLPPSLASRQVSADSGCCSDSVVPSL